ncbi:hypothetical protein CRG98_008773 [Punica granatum]|uniref:G-patch domain-containing protein n=1 Tax=Punica granatum TaxID=22663 RepID=A0A2I0KQX7_PUNGR|nr:hypothetical protein CRG98_008773 [Punica granatum]
MKMIKASEYKVMEQMGKSPAHISLLALLLSSEPHRDALLKVLTAAQIPKETTPNKIKETVNSIFSNQISFAEDELSSEVMIDNGSALNVCPVFTLKQMNVDMSRIRASKTTVRAFDGSKRKLKFFVEGKLITVDGEEDYTVYEETVVPYISIGEDQNFPFHSFDTISVIRDYGEVDPSQANRMIGKVLLKNNYVPGTGLGARAQGFLGPIEMEEYRNRRGLGFCPSCHEIVWARRGKHLHRLGAHYGKLSGGIPVPLLSLFFPAPPQIMGGTSDSLITELDDFSSDAVEAFLALSTIYAVIEETSSGSYPPCKGG